MSTTSGATDPDRAHDTSLLLKICCLNSLKDLTISSPLTIGACKFINTNLIEMKTRCFMTKDRLGCTKLVSYLDILE